LLNYDNSQPEVRERPNILTILFPRNYHFAKRQIIFSQQMIIKYLFFLRSLRCSTTRNILAQISQFWSLRDIGEEYAIDRSINSVASNLRMKTKKRTTRGFERKKPAETRIADRSCKILPFIYHLIDDAIDDREPSIFYRFPDNGAFFFLKFKRKVLLSFSIRRTWTILILRLLRPRALLTTS